MAAARNRAEWLRVGVSVAFVVNNSGWRTKPLSPLAVIPPPFRPEEEPEPEKTPEQVAEESRLAWGLLDRVFGGQ